MNWYVRRDGEVSGPFTESEIVKRIADGNITRHAMVREGTAADWCPIEGSMFEGAFGASNPFRDPSMTAKRSRLGSLFLWLAAGVVFILGLSLFGVLGPETDPARSAERLGEIIGRALVALVVWALIRFVWGLIRPKRQE